MTGFFAREPAPTDRTGWRTLAELAADPTHRIAATATALGCDERVAASIDLLAVAARVLSPALALTLQRSAVPDLTAADVWWRHDRPAAMRIGFDAIASRSGTPNAFVDSIVDATLAPLVHGYCAAAHLSPKVAWGDVASALNGAAIVLDTTVAATFVRSTLAIGALRATALRPPPRFVRNSCCLLYRTGGAYCGDCVLGPRRRVTTTG